MLYRQKLTFVLNYRASLQSFGAVTKKRNSKGEALTFFVSFSISKSQHVHTFYYELLPEMYNVLHMTRRTMLKTLF